MVNSCCICGVERSVATSHLTFHSLPTENTRRDQWLKVLNKKNIKHLLVCSKHFKPDDYRESSMKPLLKKEAVPRLDFVLESVQSTEKDDHDKIAENINESSNVVNASKAESSLDTESINSAKRKMSDESSVQRVLNKRRCIFSFGVFREDDFKDETTWNRFMKSVERVKTEKVLLRRKNTRLHQKIEKVKVIVHRLKQKKLMTHFVANLMNRMLEQKANS